MADKIKNIFVSHQHNDADKIEAVKDLREQVKGIVSGLKKDYFYQKPEEMAADICNELS